MKGKNSNTEDDQFKQIVERNNEIIHALKNLSQQISNDKKAQLSKKSERSKLGTSNRIK